MLNNVKNGVLNNIFLPTVHATAILINSCIIPPSSKCIITVCFRNIRRVVKVDFEKCKNRLTKCMKPKCSTEYDPVCGTDARTYTNQCQLNLATCIKGVQFAHLGNCTQLKEDYCPENCDNDVEEEPVCGSDGNVYK